MAPREDGPPPELAELAHRTYADTMVYGSLAKLIDPSDRHLVDGSTAFIERYLDEMAPRDHAERMLAMQMLWQHMRIGYLNRAWAGSKLSRDRVWLENAIDAAIDAARRQMLTWRTLRGGGNGTQPSQGQVQTQVNVAKKQIVVNGPIARRDPIGEGGVECQTN